jgi:hypothetical protein
LYCFCCWQETYNGKINACPIMSVSDCCRCSQTFLCNNSWITGTYTSLPNTPPPRIISNIALFRSFLPKRPILEENALFRAYFQCLNGGSNMIEIRHNNPYFHQCTWLK